MQDDMYQRLNDESTQGVAYAFHNAKSWDEQQIIVAKYAAMEYPHPDHFPLLSQIRFPTVREICDQKIPKMDELIQQAKQNEKTHQEIQNRTIQADKSSDRVKDIDAILREKSEILKKKDRDIKPNVNKTIDLEK